MFIYLSKKIAIPNGIKLCALSCNSDHGWVACGGHNGLLKVLKMEVKEATDPKAPRGIAAPSSLSMNQTLEGHAGAVVCVAWNAGYRKLTTSDQNGMIIVWILQRGVWVEEMINNRNKSFVKDMKWSPDGQKICIAYEDGAVILGSVDGNRLWGKDLPNKLSLIEWAPDGKHIVFVTNKGQIMYYDNSGNKISEIPLQVIDDSSDTPYQIVRIAWYDGCDGHLSPDVPTFALALRSGEIQINRGHYDDNPVTIFTGMDLQTCQWNINGTVLAVAGCQTVRNTEGSSTDINVVQFYDPYGTHLKSMRVPGTKIETLSWEGSGLRLCMAVDSHIYFANIRPDYRWGYFMNTLVYAFNKPDYNDTCVVFWDTISDERYIKYMGNVLRMAAAHENCVVATHNTEQPHEYLLTLCDTIGSPVDSKIIPIEPKYLIMTDFHVIAASDREVYTWQYRTQVSKLTSLTADSDNALRRKEGRERIFHVDDPDNASPCEAASYVPQDDRPLSDPICAITAANTCFIIGRSKGLVQRYTLPHIILEDKYMLRSQPLQLALNSDLTRMSIIDSNNVLSFFDLVAAAPEENRLKGSSGKGEQLDYEKKDAWSMLWADDNPELFVMVEKTRMHVYRNLEVEEPVQTSGYLCRYADLQVKTALLDDLLVTPEQPDKNFMMDYETRQLRVAHDFLNVSLEDAYQYIEKNSHPKLWKILAETALEQMDFGMAERGFVKCKDYQGIQYVKRLCMLNDKTKQKAEVAAYFQRFDEAEAIYREMDRKDLAIELRIRTGDWFRVVQLVQSGAGDDKLLTKAWNKIGEYYADRQKWKKAAQYYSQAKNTSALIKCYYKLGDFKKLHQVSESLSNGSPLLSQVAQMFQSVGLSENAASAYLRNDDTKAAIDCCVILNQWDKAVELAEQHGYPQIEGLLTKYGTELMDKGKTLEAIELYRRANRSTEAAKLLNQLGQKVGKGNSNPMRAKRLNVLAALEVERFRRKMLDVSTIGTGMTAAQTTAATLDSLMQHDKATGEHKALDNPWRGAEAYHLVLLAHRQLYLGNVDQALITGMKCTEYEDILDMKEVYSLVALAAYYTKHFEQCSNAFISLETLPGLSNQDRDAYESLALKIFINTAPKDPSSSRRVSCPSCRQKLSNWSSSCSKCNRSFQTCMMSGSTITDQRTYSCRTCRHHSIESALKTVSTCPLCHASLV